jgi:hypothetical protein
MDLGREPALPEHLDHPVVLRKDLRFEHRNPVLVGYLSQLAEEDRAESTALKVVGHGERHLGPIGTAPEVHGVADHPPVEAGGGQKAVAVTVVEVYGPAGQILEVRPAGEEPQPPRFRRELLEEPKDRTFVLAPDRANMHRGAVAEGDVSLAVSGVGAHLMQLTGGEPLGAGPFGPRKAGPSSLSTYRVTPDTHGEMFTYYFVVVPGLFEDVERALLELLDGLPGHADVAYREGEELRTRLRPGDRAIAKTVRLYLGNPHHQDDQVRIPLTWEATGTPGLFPRMDADLVLAAVGPELTHLEFRGTYRPPLGPIGRALDRALLHRVAEASVKSFVDRLASAMLERMRRTAGAA